MLEKFFKMYEKYFYVIILLLFIVITSLGVYPLYNLLGKSTFIKTIVEVNFNVLKTIRDYKYILYTVILVISSIYVLFKGNKRNKIILGIVIGTSILTFLNSILSKQNYFISLEIKSIVAFPLFFVFLNVFEIFIRRNGKQFIENLLFKTIKIVSVYIGIMFLLGKITNLYYITYLYSPYGYSGRFLERNAISHVFVMILPLFMYFFYTKKEYKTIFYILISIICALLIGTKSAYFAVYTSLILFLVVLIISYIKTKKINYKKLLIISTILIVLFAINDHLYTPQFMKRNIDIYTLESGNTETTEEIGNTEAKEEIGNIEDKKLDKVKFVLNGRENTLKEIWWVYKNKGLYEKMVGLGFYYPKYHYVLIEMDFFDILFKQGIIGLSLYLYTAIYYIVLMIKNIKQNLKKLPLLELLFPLASISMVTLASMVAGHVMYNYITIFFYSLIIIFLYTKTELKE